MKDTVKYPSTHFQATIIICYPIAVLLLLNLDRLLVDTSKP